MIHSVLAQEECGWKDEKFLSKHSMSLSLTHTHTHQHTDGRSRCLALSEMAMFTNICCVDASQAQSLCQELVLKKLAENNISADIGLLFVCTNASTHHTSAVASSLVGMKECLFVDDVILSLLKE